MKMVKDDAAALIAARIAKILEQSRDGLLARVSAIESAADALGRGEMAADDRRNAEREAHKLAGVAGTFGFHEASELSKEAELLLRAETVLDASDVARLAWIGAELRRQLTPSVAE